MEFEAREVDIGTPTPTVLVNGEDAEELGVHPLDRVQVDRDGRTTVAIVEVTDGLVSPGTLGVTKRLGHLEGRVDVTLAPKPGSARYIRKKLDDVELEEREIRTIVRDVNENRLNDVELAAYVSGIYCHGLSLAETKLLTQCMTDVGDTIAWEDGPIADKHSIGGVAGNRVTPIVVPIVAAAGVKIPKTSSRAVTSPAGTADTMEVFCEVDFSLPEIRGIVRETNGCMVWGGGVNLSPVDDKIIRAETPLSLDPPGQIIASVLSKKKSAGSTHVLVDIPYGEGAKVAGLPEARELSEDFERVGEHLGMRVECVVSEGGAPVGRGIGPVLEARDVLEVLSGDGPQDLRRKGVRLAGIVLDLCGVADAEAEARELLASGAALAKFREIVAAQGGDPDVAVADLEPGGHREVVTADRPGEVTRVDNRLVSDVARRAGAPKDAGAGVDLRRAVGDPVDAGDPLFAVHAEQSAKLSDAMDLVGRTEALRVRDPEDARIERV